MKKGTFFIFIILLYTHYGVFSQNGQSGNVSGFITDKSSQPLSFSSVALVNLKDSSLVKGTMSDENGVFVFKNVLNGKYLVWASIIGYDKGISQAFEISDGNKDIQLDTLRLLSSSKLLSETVVSAQKPLIVNKSDKMIMNVENSILASGNSALDILEKAPGVRVDDNIILRGKQKLIVLIDGKDTHLSQAQLYDLLRTTNGNSIESIEIMTTPSTKYDAAGNAGIINIKLKKSSAGTNLHATVIGGYGVYPKASTNLAFNHRNKKFNFFANCDYTFEKTFQDLDIYRIITLKTDQQYFHQKGRYATTNKNGLIKLGTDYYINKNNIIGVTVSGYLHDGNIKNSTKTDIGSKENETDSALVSNNAGHAVYSNLIYNLNYKSILDTLGQELSIDVDYLTFSTEDNFTYHNNLYDYSGNILREPGVIRNLTPATTKVYSIKLDYALPINKKLEMETGAKTSLVKTDNNYILDSLKENVWKSTNQNNAFKYDETIYAAYVNLKGKFKNLEMEGGVRVEQTISKGNSSLSEETVNRNYTNLFPSARIVKRNQDSKHEIALAYSRRIDRPDYANLNPFIYFVDKYTYNKGNPFISPQYSDVVDLSYSFKSKYIASIGYTYTKDIIMRVLLVDEKNAFFQTYVNLDRQISYNLNLTAPVNIGNWWNIYNNLTFYYVDINIPAIKNKLVSFQFSCVNNFSLNESMSFEVTGKYLSPMISGTIYLYKPQYYLDIGINKRFFKKRGNLIFSVSDVFNSYIRNMKSNVPDVNYTFAKKYETRVARLTFSYHFGSSVKLQKRKETGVDDELRRIKY